VPSKAAHQTDKTGGRRLAQYCRRWPKGLPGLRHRGTRHRRRV